MRSTTQDSSFAGKPLRFWYGVIVAFCFILYGNTVWNEYGLDDNLVTNHNVLVAKGVSGLYEIFTTNYVVDEKFQLDYRPLTKASFALEYALFKWNPHISHFINIALYALSCVLLLQVMLAVFGFENFRWILIGTLLYAAHPIHTEVVASLKNREEIFVLLFTLLATQQFLKFTDKANYKYWVFGLLLFLLALLSKISALPFVASIPLLLFYSQQRKSVKSIWRNTAIAGVALVVLSGVYYTVVISSLPGFARPYEYVETPIPYLNNVSDKFGIAFLSLWWYIKLLFIPYPLSYYYGISYVPILPATSLLPIVSLLIHAGIFMAALFYWTRQRIVSMLLLFYLVQIAMYSNLVLPLAGVVAERALFFSSVSFTFLLAYVIMHLLKYKKSTSYEWLIRLQLSLTASIALAVVLICYSTLTIVRNFDWKDTITLYKADIGHLQNSAKANFMIAKEVRRLYRNDKALTKESLDLQSAEAAKYYRQAISAYPQYAQAMEALGTIYLTERSNMSEAIPLFEQAYGLDSTLWRSAFNLGRYYQMQKQPETALLWYNRALIAKPGYLRALIEAAKLNYSTGNKARALALNDTILQYYPTSFVPYYNFGMYYMLEGDTTKAVKHFEEDIARGEPEKFPYSFLMRHYLQLRDTMNAVRVRNTAATNQRKQQQQPVDVVDE